MYINCFECQNQFLYTTCSPHVPSLNFQALNNMLSYCGLVDDKIRASDKDLPVLGCVFLAFLKAMGFQRWTRNGNIEESQNTTMS